MVYCIEDITPFINGQSKLMASKFQDISNLGLSNDVITKKKKNSRPNAVTKYILTVGLSTTTDHCQTYGKEHELSQPFSSTPLDRSYLISKSVSLRSTVILSSNFLRGFSRKLPQGVLTNNSQEFLLPLLHAPCHYSPIFLESIILKIRVF
jgi:hypothetical protein